MTSSISRLRPSDTTLRKTATFCRVFCTLKTYKEVQPVQSSSVCPRYIKLLCLTDYFFERKILLCPKHRQQVPMLLREVRDEMKNGVMGCVSLCKQGFGTDRQSQNPELLFSLLLESSLLNKMGKGCFVRKKVKTDRKFRLWKTIISVA